VASIEVIAIGSKEFEVIVDERGDETHHRVTVPDGYAEELGVGGDAALNRLVHESFRFLLEREPKEQILSTFELPVIERYFPAYRDEIAERLASGDG
jgi:hypothetical protein